MYWTGCAQARQSFFPCNYPLVASLGRGVILEEFEVCLKVLRRTPTGGRRGSKSNSLLLIIFFFIKNYFLYIIYIMPYKKNYKKPYKKRYNRNRRNYKLSIKKSPMPTKFTTKLKYSDTFSLTATTTAGTATAYIYSGNGLYDPDITSVLNHQPRGFDELMAIYNNYRVLGCKITLRGCWLDPNVGVVFGAAVFNDSSIKSLLTDYLERSYSVKRICGTNDGSSVITMNYKFCPHKFLGQKYDEDTLSGTASANPSDQAYIHVFLASVKGSAGSEMAGSIEIEYLTQFHEPKFLTQS